MEERANETAMRREPRRREPGGEREPGESAADLVSVGEGGQEHLPQQRRRLERAQPERGLRLLVCAVRHGCEFAGYLEVRLVGYGGGGVE